MTKLDVSQVKHSIAVAHQYIPKDFPLISSDLMWARDNLDRLIGLEEENQALKAQLAQPNTETKGVVMQTLTRIIHELEKRLSKLEQTPTQTYPALTNIALNHEQANEIYGALDFVKRNQFLNTYAEALVKIVHEWNEDH